MTDVMTMKVTAEIARDADDVDFCVAYLRIKLNPCAKVHRLITMYAPPKHNTVLTNRETVIQGHSRSFIIAVPIHAAYPISCQ